MPITNQDPGPSGVSKENDLEENQVPEQSRETPFKLVVHEKVQEGSQVVLQVEELPVPTIVEASLATPHSQEVQISNPPKDGIGLTTSDGVNLEDKNLVGQELTNSKEYETTSDQLGNRLEDQSLNSNPTFEESTKMEVEGKGIMFDLNEKFDEKNFATDSSRSNDAAKILTLEPDMNENSIINEDEILMQFRIETNR
ncbi:hypothetical protein ACH5RR_029967 [Cinchona calisaya]|uniref:Uncharacterized protein n=1 Tax=Cinchona calisaya TaxID=153742 RepID=A0ABD2YVH2_9GENT